MKLLSHWPYALALLGAALLAHQAFGWWQRESLEAKIPERISGPIMATADRETCFWVDCEIFCKHCPVPWLPISEAPERFCATGRKAVTLYDAGRGGIVRCRVVRQDDPGADIAIWPEQP